MTTISARLRAAGFTVVGSPVAGASGSFTPAGVMWHHYVGSCDPARAAGEAAAARTSFGHSPIYNLTVDDLGRVHTITDGRANHAGRGGPFGGWIPTDQGNRMTIGISGHCSGAHRLGTHATLYRTMTAVTAELCRWLGVSADRVLGHREYTSRKIDPRDNMTTVRADVRAALAPPPPPPDPEPPTLEGLPEMFMYLSAISGRAVMVTGGRQVFAEAGTANNALRPMAGDPPLYFRASEAWERRMVAAFGPIVDAGASSLSAAEAAGPELGE